VSEGYFSFEDAIKLAEKILYSNPAAVYQVK